MEKKKKNPWSGKSTRRWWKTCFALLSARCWPQIVISPLSYMLRSRTTSASKWTLWDTCSRTVSIMTAVSTNTVGIHGKVSDHKLCHMYRKLHVIKRTRYYKCKSQENLETVLPMHPISSGVHLSVRSFIWLKSKEYCLKWFGHVYKMPGTASLWRPKRP